MKKIKICLIICFLLSFKIGLSQNNHKDSLDTLIQNLNWKSFEIISFTYVTQVVLVGGAKKIAENPPDILIIKKLLDSIQNENKTIAIHIILSEIFNEPLKFSWKYTYFWRFYSQDSIHLQ